MRLARSYCLRSTLLLSSWCSRARSTSSPSSPVRLSSRPSIRRNTPRSSLLRRPPSSLLQTSFRTALSSWRANFWCPHMKKLSRTRLRARGEQVPSANLTSSSNCFQDMRLKSLRGLTPRASSSRVETPGGLNLNIASLFLSTDRMSPPSSLPARKTSRQPSPCFRKQNRRKSSLSSTSLLNSSKIELSSAAPRSLRWSATRAEIYSESTSGYSRWRVTIFPPRITTCVRVFTFLQNFGIRSITCFILNPSSSSLALSCSAGDSRGRPCSSLCRRASSSGSRASKEATLRTGGCRVTFCLRAHLQRGLVWKNLLSQKVSSRMRLILKLMWRYFKITALESHPNGWEAYYRSIKLYERGGTTLSGGKCSCSGHDEANARRAFSQDLEDKYRSAMNPGGCGDWVAYEHNKEVSLGRVVIQQYGQDCNHISKLKLECSKDGVHWVLAFRCDKTPHLLDTASTPLVWGEAGFPPKEEELSGEEAGRIEKVTNHKKVIGGGNKVTYIRSQRVTFAIDSKAGIDFHAGYRPAFRMCSFVERVLRKYGEVTGFSPALIEGFPGQLIEVAKIPAAGLARHGVFGVAMGPAFFQETYDRVAKGEEMLHQLFYYEIFRNYSNPEKFDVAFAYQVEDNAHMLVQGCVNIVGCLLAAEIGLGFSYNYTMDRDGFRRYMEDILDDHIKRGAAWQDCLGVKVLIPWMERTSIDNIWSGILSRLYSLLGPGFLPRFFALAARHHDRIVAISAPERRIKTAVVGICVLIQEELKKPKQPLLQLFRGLRWEIDWGVGWARDLK